MLILIYLDNKNLPSCLVVQTSIGCSFNILSGGQPIKTKLT